MAGPRAAAAPPRPDDPGLARERTTLAWRRTALALVVNGVLLLARHERALPHPWSLALGAAATAASVLALVVAARRTRAGVPTGPATTSVLSLGICLVLLCAATTLTLLVVLLSGTSTLHR